MGARFGGGMGMGVGGLVVLLILSAIFKKDLTGMLGGGGSNVADPGTAAPYQETATEKDRREFVTYVFNDAQDTWRQSVNGYRDAKLVLFTDATDSGCGFAQSASGPFYCPMD
jgi:predicted metalloprotease